MASFRSFLMVFAFGMIMSCNSAIIRRENSSSIRKYLDSESESSGQSQEDKEAACWNVIFERSGEYLSDIFKGMINFKTNQNLLISLDGPAVAFALQNRVLNELQVELLDTSSEKTRDKVNQLADTMRANMNEAIAGLKEESAERYFRALFKISDNIVQFSTIMRDPDNDDRQILPSLARATSRLGRYNSNLVQEITERCSLLKKSPIY